MHAYIKLFTEDDAQGIEASQGEAKRCVILAIRAVDVINFAELVDLPAIKSLQAKNADLIKLLNLLSQSSAQDFAGQLGSLKKLIDAEGLTEKELITKKSYVQICTLDTNTSNFKYEELSQLLNIAQDDVEMWAIEAIQNRIIDAKIDQLNEVIVIKSHMLRELKEQEWRSIQTKIQSWKERFQRV